MSFTHPLDVAQALLKGSTGTSPTGSAFNVKSFDASPVDLAKGILAATGMKAEVKKTGMFGGQSLGKYTDQQLKGALLVQAQENWKDLGYAPQFNAESTAQEVAKWHMKHPWAAEEE